MIERTPEDHARFASDMKRIAGERTQHTPGPWKINSHDDFEMGDSGPILSVSDFAPSGLTEYDEAKANARLIAAAPELLDIAKAMLLMGEHIDIAQGTRLDRIFVANFKALRAVIAKAEGRAS